MKKVYYSKLNDLYFFMCPGCGVHHGINKEIHQYDGNLEYPTFEGSVGWTGKNIHRPGNSYCHSFVKNGMISFLTDSQHDLAGKTVPLPSIE